MNNRMTNTVRAFAAALLLASCTDEDGTRNALGNMGFTDITITGVDLFACGKDDTCTGFTATNAQGRRVKGAVGCGHFAKGCTVRF